MPSVKETLVVLTYPSLVRRIVESRFGCHERTRALNVAISAIFTHDPTAYIHDVIAQRGLSYLDYAEEVERYVALFQAAQRHFHAPLQERQTPFSERLVTIRDMTIEHETLVFVLQHISVTG